MKVNDMTIEKLAIMCMENNYSDVEIFLFLSTVKNFGLPSFPKTLHDVLDFCDKLYFIFEELSIEGAKKNNYVGEITFDSFKELCPNLNEDLSHMILEYLVNEE